MASSGTEVGIQKIPTDEHGSWLVLLESVIKKKLKFLRNTKELNLIPCQSLRSNRHPMVPELTEVSINGGNKKKNPHFSRPNPNFIDFYSTDLFDTLIFPSFWRVWDLEKKKKNLKNFQKKKKKKIQILKVGPTCLFRRSVRCWDTFIF